MKFIIVCILLIAGSVFAATKTETCVAQLRSGLDILGKVDKTLDTNSETDILKMLADIDTLLNPILFACDNVTNSASFSSEVGEKSKCYNLIHDAAFLTAVARKVSIDKDWKAFFSATEDASITIKLAKKTCKSA